MWTQLTRMASNENMLHQSRKSGWAFRIEFMLKIGKTSRLIYVLDLCFRLLDAKRN